jgi:lipid II:glycine glycyltransferase (peptidoglycan interpeptide bridge formation enzyme)
MSTEKNENKNETAEDTGGEVINILPFLSRTSLKDEKPEESEDTAEQLDLPSTLSDLITVIELSTDDIAGTLIARYVYKVDLLPDVESKLLFDELELRIKAHMDLVEQLKEHIEK